MFYGMAWQRETFLKVLHAEKKTHFPSPNRKVPIFHITVALNVKRWRGILFDFSPNNEHEANIKRASNQSQTEIVKDLNGERRRKKVT